MSHVHGKQIKSGTIGQIQLGSGSVTSDKINLSGYTVDPEGPGHQIVTLEYLVDFSGGSINKLSELNTNMFARNPTTQERIDGYYKAMDYDNNPNYRLQINPMGNIKIQVNGVGVIVGYGNTVNDFQINSKCFFKDPMGNIINDVDLLRSGDELWWIGKSIDPNKHYDLDDTDIIDYIMVN